MSILEVQLDGVERLIKLFGNVREAIDPDTVVDHAGAILLNRIGTRFLNETDPDGRRWPESKAAQRRRATGRGGGTLYDTGNLFHSIQLFKRGTGVRAIGTDVPYARKHQEGLDGLPARVFLGFSQDDAVIVTKLIQRRIDQAKKR